MWRLIKKDGDHSGIRKRRSEGSRIRHPRLGLFPMRRDLLCSRRSSKDGRCSPVLVCAGPIRKAAQRHGRGASLLIVASQPTYLHPRSNLAPSFASAFLGSACGITVSYTLGRVFDTYASSNLCRLLTISVSPSPHSASTASDTTNMYSVGSPLQVLEFALL